MYNRSLHPRFWSQSTTSDYRTSTSESESSLATPSSSSTTYFFSPTYQTTITTLFSTALTTPSPTPSTTTPPPSSSEPPSSSTRPTSPSSGFVFSTFTSSFVSQINGSSTTIVTPIVTAFRSSAASRSSSRTSIIVGSTIAGIALLVMVLAALFCLQKRRRRRRRYWALSRGKRLQSRSTFLPGEEEIPGEEIELPFPSRPFASLDQPDPFSTHSSHHNSSAAGSVDSDIGGSGGAPVYPRHSFSRPQSPSSSHTRAENVSLSASLPPPSTSFTPPPRLLRARASETGSIFQESVWPPPSAASQLMDPLTYPSQSIDLARVVTDVMGPPESGPLLLLQPNPSSPEQGQGQEQEQEQGALNRPGEEGERERRGAMIPSSTIALPTSPDNWSPRSEFQSSPSSSPPSSPPRPLLLPRSGSESESEQPLRPPSTPWLSRPLNPSPKGSPLQRTVPL